MTDQRNDTAGVIAPPPLIAAATFALGLGLEWLAPLHILVALAGWRTRVGLGCVLVVAGAGVAFAAERRFRRVGTNAEPWKPALALATDGIYGWIRNPMYVGLMLVLAGFGVGLAADWVVGLVVPMGLVLHVGVVRREERYLEARFGAPYRAYRDRVPRYGIRLFGR
ncbi:MAG TPA: isoprenylcysteine carboxylmethyltransferase family protein [Xanthobacteraceae bacterium]|jgi:protein-S-isoprenylcysteine O-methyltransferase Ste14